MIKAVGEIDGRRLILLGIDDENVRRLTAGEPIRVSGKEIGQDVDILIMHGETLGVIAAQLKRAGVIGPDVKINRSGLDDHEGLT